MLAVDDAPARSDTSEELQIRARGTGAPRFPFACGSSRNIRLRRIVRTYVLGRQGACHDECGFGGTERRANAHYHDVLDIEEDLARADFFAFTAAV